MFDLTHPIFFFTERSGRFAAAGVPGLIPQHRPLPGKGGRTMRSYFRDGKRTLLAVVVFGSVCFFSVVAAADPIVIGIPHSQAYPYAEMMKNSFTMAADRINAEGGIKGRPLKLVYANDQGKKDPGQEAIRHLVKKEKVVMLVGAYQSSNTLFMAMTADRLGVPFLVCTAADDRITQRKLQNVFRLNPPAKDYAAGLQQFFTDVVKPGSMAIVYENSPYGTSGAMQMMWFCRERDIDLRAIVPYHKEKARKESIGTPYFKRLLAPIAARPPDVIYMVSYLNDAVLLVKLIDEMDIDSLLTGGAGGFTHQKFIDKSGKKGEYLITAALWCPQLRYQGAGAYYENYIARYTVPPDYHGAEAYSALLVAADALERAKSMRPEDVRTALHSSRLMTPFGPVEFSTYDKFERQNRLPTMVLQVIGGRFECIWPRQHASARFVPPVGRR
jgi:branched-chain amino acid transport system substrate-binding protein